MTRDDIVALLPGRTTDAMIAYHVFGWRYRGWWRCSSRLPNYSTEFRDMEEVLESFPEQVSVELVRRGPGDWACAVWDCDSRNQIEFVEAKTAAHAVCLARLLVWFSSDATEAMP